MIHYLPPSPSSSSPLCARSLPRREMDDANVNSAAVMSDPSRGGADLDFMFETSYTLRVTDYFKENLVIEGHEKRWDHFKKYFDPNQRDAPSE